MTNPTNPLFDDEKAFLERKKLEYERALRGDVEEIKDQTVQAGKVALLGASAVGGIWLLTKVFGGKSKKKKPKKNRRSFEDYAGSGFNGYEADDQDLNEFSDDFQDPEYAYEHATSFDEEGADDGFLVTGASEAGYSDDDNGLGQYPDFPAHSSPQHGADTAENTAADDYFKEEDDEDKWPDHSLASPNSYQARPYDDSRRLPHSDSFTEASDSETTTPKPAEAKQPAAPKSGVIGPALLAFAKSDAGRVVVAQAAAVAMALATKAIQRVLPKYGDDTDKNADLAASHTTPGIPPATWPATSAAQDATAAASHDDDRPTRAPLA